MTHLQEGAGLTRIESSLHAKFARVLT